MLRFVGTVSFLATAALLVATGMFALDVLQMRLRVEEIQSSVLRCDPRDASGCG